MKQIKDINTTHRCTIVAFQTTYMTSQHFLVLKYSFNLFINVMMIALITRHTIKIFLYSITKASILSLANHHKNLRMYFWPTQLMRLQLHRTQKHKSVTDVPPVYQKSEKYKHFRKQNWLGAVQIEAEFDYMVNWLLLEMTYTILTIFKKLCNLVPDQNPLSY